MESLGMACCAEGDACSRAHHRELSCRTLGDDKGQLLRIRTDGGHEIAAELLNARWRDLL
jgi:hypothetical protein